VCIALRDLYHLGVLSSAIHVVWALASGGRLEDRPRYQKALCFDPFPFADAENTLADLVAEVMPRIDQHRRQALVRGSVVTMTTMYNVVEKLRSGEELTHPERRVHELAACGVLRDLHHELDAAVARCYGWEWPLPEDIILERLVALHDERRAEEEAGTVR